MKKLIPEKDRLLLELEPVKEDIAAAGVTNGGVKYKIHTPETHHQRTRRATVLAVGEVTYPGDVDRFKPGDTVIVSFHVGLIIHDFELGWHDDTHRICRADQVLGKIKE